MLVSLDGLARRNTLLQQAGCVHPPIAHPELEENEFQMTLCMISINPQRQFTRVHEPLLCWVGGFCKQINIPYMSQRHLSGAYMFLFS